jgi:aerobic-type carbon monoxide dehydrogenase small subunit (CoxS/CutS family)
LKINFLKTPMKKDSFKNNPEDESRSENSKKGISRRGFLRGAGLTTVGTMALQTGVLGDALAQEEIDEKFTGPEAGVIELRVNGKIRTLLIEPRTTLASALRDHLQLTGTKIVCDRGACSACTVWVDGKPVNSCLTLAVEVVGQEITTIEGIGTEDQLHPVQEAFIEHDASQCGYCTPGMIMTATHFLKNNPTPNLEDVKVALRGNLCRCGTHPNVFKATLAASKKM